ncbi:hypothetical protein [Altererythrobacter sp. MF3-039]|uniref:hypothetical protein n=1 Tax=Altererythrobacter sp. MF3-039 TaxID=3252901 RepID=UPI00390C4975
MADPSNCTSALRESTRSIPNRSASARHSSAVAVSSSSPAGIALSLMMRENSGAFMTRPHARKTPRADLRR